MGCSKSRMLEPNRVHPDFNRKSPAFVRRSMREIRRIARMFVANTNPVEPSILECAETSSCASTSIPSPEPETLFRNSSSSLSLLSNSDVSLHVMSSRHNSKEITDKFVTNDWNPNLGSRASLSDEDEDDEVLRVWYCSVSPKPSSPFQDDNDVGDMVRVFWTRSYCDISEPIRLDTVSKTIESKVITGTMIPQKEEDKMADTTLPVDHPVTNASLVETNIVEI